MSILRAVTLRESHEAATWLVWLASRHELTEQFRALFNALEALVTRQTRQS